MSGHVTMRDTHNKTDNPIGEAKFKININLSSLPTTKTIKKDSLSWWSKLRAMHYFLDWLFYIKSLNCTSIIV